MSINQLNQFIEELEKEEGITVQVEEVSKEISEILATKSNSTRCSSKCGSCAQCKAPELFEEEKMAA